MKTSGNDLFNRLFMAPLVSGALLLLLGGCTLQEATPNVAASPAPVSAVPPGAPPVAPMAGAPAPSAPGAAPGGAMTPPMMGGGGLADPMAPLTPTPDMDKAVADANKSGDKKKIGAAYTKRGLFRMKDANAGARVKYRASLSDLRKAVAADPANAEAKAAKQEIEDIYTQMGRPIPTDDVP